ncbi:MAG: outer membrane protein assembly factor BamA [Pseudomonadota bacterium]
MMHWLAPRKARALFGCLAIGWLACFFVPAYAQVAANANFTVQDLRVEGLRRISEGTVYNYLPINIGDQLNPVRLREAFRALYAQGFFDGIEFRRDGNTLVVVVRERPSIASFDISGNEDIKTEDLLGSLREVGLSPGRSFDRSVLDSVTQFLTQQYFERGKYGVTVDTSVTDLPDNRVSIQVFVEEGVRARIRQINIVGNDNFKDTELLDEFQLSTPTLLSFLNKRDRYAREALQGDLESLRSFYMDRGFASFEIESTQVAISPDKQDMFITVNIEEGERYTISEVRMTGDLVVPEEDLLSLVLSKPGETFSRKQVTQSTELMGFRLGQEGYAFANINPIPDINPETREVAISFFVEPGKRVYVRRVNFNGTTTVDDDVFRREMRQLEGGYLSNVQLERSEQRVRRLPFVTNVSTETVPVPGSDDLVDVEMEIEEGLPGQFGGGIGFSGTQGILLNGNFTHTNFLGRGTRLAADLNLGQFVTSAQVSHTNPYWTKDGVQLTLGLGYRDSTQFIIGASDFSTETINASFEFGVPISEFGFFRYGLAYQSADLVTGQFSAEQARAFVLNNGDTFEVADGFFGTTFRTIEAFLGWGRDTRNRVIFATRGSRQRLTLGVTAPEVSDVEYVTARYDYLKYINLPGRWGIRANAELGYGEPLNDTTDLPPFKNFFAGGPGSVRGYRNGFLGPRDSFNNPYGGNVKVVGNLELLIPTPENFGDSTRFALFYDIGNIFYEGDTDFCTARADNGNLVGTSCSTPSATRADFGFDLNELRSSVGIGVEWLAPLGTFRFSLAVPLNAGPLDEVERFQFSVGQTF